ncbi:MAG: septation regulator SpoVG [Ruminococcaceae bacterium]|nr:septation regulator SpoVG [Oscillospiraceae bacterium]
MTVTEIRMKHIEGDERLRALATVTLDGELAVHDVKVIQGEDRLFIAMPSRRMADGRFRDIVHPVSKDARERLEEAVLRVYREQAQQTRIIPDPLRTVQNP